MGTFENTLKHIIWKPLKPYGDIWKYFETHNLKSIETKWGHWKIFWNIIWKPLKPMRNFENPLKHIIWKPLKPMGTFENNLKDIIWKQLKCMEKFENTLKHIIWKPLKLNGDIWKHFETHHLKTIETKWGHLKTLWNT